MGAPKLADFPQPWHSFVGEFTVVITDADEEVLVVVEPAMDRENQTAIARRICSAINGPRLLPEAFYRERHSGRIQTGRQWNREFQDVVSREFEENDPEEELGH